MYDIVVVGAGTAGLSAAIYGVRAGKSVLVLEGASYGGQIINTPEIENYPAIKKTSGFEFATDLFNQAKDLAATTASSALNSSLRCITYTFFATLAKKVASSIAVLPPPFTATTLSL